MNLTRRTVLAGGLAAATPALARTRTIVALGDSLTAGFGLRAGEAFPARLEALLKAQGKDVAIRNAGLSGDTTAGGLARLAFATQAPVDGVMVGLGANDMLQGRPVADARANLDAILTRLRGRRLPVVLLGMRAPTNWGADYQRAFDGLYPALARKHGATLYPFLLDGVALDPKLNQRDGIHPNAQGAALIARRLAPVVIRAFSL